LKILTVGAGVLLLAGGLYIAVGERMVGTSADATVNARIVTMRAPVDGTMTFSAGTIGTRLAAGQPIAEIFDTRHDNVRLLELEKTKETLQSELARSTRQLQSLQNLRDQMLDQAGKYQQGRVRQIDTRLAEAKATLESAHSRLRETESTLKRTTDLSARSLITAITLERAQSAFEIAQQDVKSADQRVSALTTELESARNGVFLGDSYNDMPFSSQRIRDFDLRLSDLSADRGQIEQRLTQTEQQIAKERVRLNNLTSAALTAPTAVMVWDRLAESGEHVRRGQDLVRLAECSNLIITASVSESVFNTLTPGAQAQLRLFGDSRVFAATVIRLGGSGAGALYANMAVGASAEHLKRFDITLKAPALADHSDLECAIGRTGRLVFSRGPAAAIAQAATRLGL
jgi:multidrug resistance efflux pump